VLKWTSHLLYFTGVVDVHATVPGNRRSTVVVDHTLRAVRDMSCTRIPHVLCHILRRKLHAGRGMANWIHAAGLVKVEVRISM